MIRTQLKLRHRLLIAALTLPLFSSSCADIATRATINGFFNATIPVADQQLEDQIAQRLEDQEDA